MTRPAALPSRLLARGFTLLELMVVCALLGSVLLLLPPSLEGYGSRGRLEQGASMLASAITAARDQAVIDGHAVVLEYDLENDRFRFQVSARVRERAAPTRDGTAETPTPTVEPEPDEEWVVTAWTELPTGVDLAGYSEAKEQWEHGRTQSIPVTFSPEGIVRPAHALRVESRTMSRGDRVMTVRVNALTSLSEVVPGEAEMPEKRDPGEFR